MRERWPYVWMVVLFTAVSESGSGERLRSAGVGGITLTSEPVSIRKDVLVCASLTKNRRLVVVEPVPPVAASVRPRSFPSCMEAGTCWQRLRTCGGTSRVGVAVAAAAGLGGRGCLGGFSWVRGNLGGGGGHG